MKKSLIIATAFLSILGMAAVSVVNAETAPTVNAATTTTQPVVTPTPKNYKMKLEINPQGQVNLQGNLESIEGTVMTVNVHGIKFAVNTANAKFGSLANNLTTYAINDSVVVQGELDKSASTPTINAKKVGNMNINNQKDKKNRENERKQEDDMDKEDGNKFPSLDKHNEIKDLKDQMKDIKKIENDIKKNNEKNNENKNENKQGDN